MHRRRLFRPRFTRNQRVRNQSSPKAVRAIRHAHQLIEAGNFERASQEFIHLAGVARRRRLPQAPILLMQAAKAQLELRKVDQALASIKQALGWLKTDRRWRGFALLGGRAVGELAVAGFMEEAENIQNLLDAELANVHLPDQLGGDLLLQRQFPEKCPYCGGTLLPEYSNVLDDGSLACSYCGSSINYE
jgi:hypothetical protein